MIALFKSQLRRAFLSAKPYLVATLIVLAAHALKLATPHRILHEIPFLIFFSAVVLSGIYGGFAVGVYATIISAALSDYYFLPPTHTFIKNDWHQDFKIFLYIVDCLTMAAICGSLRDALANAKHASAEESAARKRLESVAEELRATVSNLREERDLRERFVAALTHDLRTPITGAKLTAQMLMRKLEPEAAGKAHRIAMSMDRADAMIRDLLDASRIKAGDALPIRRESCNLTRLGQATVEDLTSIHGDRFVLRSSFAREGHLDPSAVRRIIENLASNAVKYGAKDAPVTVQLADLGGNLEIRVHNHGEAIPEANLSDLFQLFRRSAIAERGGQEGWGIGLSLVKGLADSHGGAAGVESNAQAGTTFWVRLPAMITSS